MKKEKYVLAKTSRVFGAMEGEVDMYGKELIWLMSRNIITVSEKTYSGIGAAKGARTRQGLSEGRIHQKLAPYTQVVPFGRHEVTCESRYELIDWEILPLENKEVQTYLKEEN